jgi:electron transfer flavoprotein beta subunit
VLRILVFVKHVPDAASDRSFTPDGTVDRSVPGRLSELDEYAIEQALQAVEKLGTGEIVIATMGPEGAAGTLRKALSMGGDSAIHVLDSGLAGTDALGTSRVLAAVAKRAGFDLIICGMASTDAGMSVIPAMLAERLGVPQLTFAAGVSVEPGRVRIRRDDGRLSQTVEATLPAVISVTDQTGEARYPSFKGIMAAKRKSIDVWDLASLDVDGVGLAQAGAAVQTFEKRPPREAGQVVQDDGSGGGAKAIQEFLVAEKLIAGGTGR